MIQFRQVNFPADFEISLKIIRESFITVADEFHLTPENCPSNPAFIDKDQLNALPTDFRELFLLVFQDKAAGFVGIEKSQKETGVYFIEKVAVLPEFRHKGLGKKIMQFAVEKISKNGGLRASVAIIDENKILKEWYKSLGFQEAEVKKFSHLPFTVCFMNKELG